MKMLVGEAFLTLLKSTQIKIQSKFLVLLEQESTKMLAEWSSDILEIWTEVYAIVLAQLNKIEKTEKYNTACRKIVVTMSDRNQAIKVRIQVASLIGFLAKYDSIGSVDKYVQMFLSE